MSKINTHEAVYDAHQLGKGRMLVLGFQHMFAMFGATILVPTITGLSVSATLLFAGLGTLLFHFFTKMKVPAFLGSSFAFIGGYATVVEMGKNLGMSQIEALPYACIGVAAAGLLYFVLAGCVKAFGVQRVMRLFPPVVTGPIIIAIGLNLSGVAINNILSNWWIAVVAILTVIICNIWGKGMIKIIPILLGVVVSYALAACFGQLEAPKVEDLRNAAWIGLPFCWDNTGMHALASGNWSFLLTAIIAIMPIAFATMIEHIGDICAIGSTTNRNYLEDPGLHRTLMGDGAATVLASLFGAPANTTYGENTGVLNLTRVFDPRVIRIAAIVAIIFSFSPKFAALIYAMPTATIGGVSLILYGMISSVGIRSLVENKVDLTESRNLIITALVITLAVGINYGCPNGAISFGTISLSGLAIAAIIGILAALALPTPDETRE
ncbi:MAG: uracil-xanthine permease family protein [Bacteroidales bacterium]|nr:uracil-xanthine permease family protein [Bacteroidales bacterium]